MLLRCALACCLISGISSADYQEKRTLTLNTQGLSKFNIDAGAGKLFVTGASNIDTITVKATIRLETSSDSKAERYISEALVLKLEKKGSRAVLVSDFDDDWSISNLIRGNLNSRIDIELTMPESMELDVHDGSGNLDIENIRNDVEVDDGSGNMKLKKITGSLTIDDGSGNILVEAVRGDVEIDDGSGNTTLDTIIGNVDVDDGSGTIVIEAVTGSVEIRDGSGNIRVDQVTKNVDILDNGSGSSRISNVDGWVKERS